MSKYTFIFWPTDYELETVNLKDDQEAQQYAAELARSIGADLDEVAAFNETEYFMMLLERELIEAYYRQELIAAFTPDAMIIFMD